MREKVIHSARELGLDVDVRRLDASTATAEDAAVAVGCDQAQIAKSLVFIADGDPVLVITSGSHRVDLNCLCDALDCAECRQATPDEVRAATGFPVGGVPRSATACPWCSTSRCSGTSRSGPRAATATACSRSSRSGSPTARRPAWRRSPSEGFG